MYKIWYTRWRKWLYTKPNVISTQASWKEVGGHEGQHGNMDQNGTSPKPHLMCCQEKTYPHDGSWFLNYNFNWPIAWSFQFPRKKIHDGKICFKNMAHKLEMMDHITYMRLVNKFLEDWTSSILSHIRTSMKMANWNN